MSFDGHVLWKRMLIGPCALTTVGAATVATVAAAAPRKNLRRVADLDVRDCSVVMGIALLGFLELPRGLLGAAWCMNHRDGFPIPARRSLYGLIPPQTRCELSRLDLLTLACGTADANVSLTVRMGWRHAGVCRSV